MRASGTGQVPETRFGAWFQQTGIWARYVVGPALADLHRLRSDSADASELPRFDRILDAGCGTGVGFRTIEALWKPRTLTAIELDPALLESARREALGLGCEVEVRREDLERLTFPDASFDLVVCHQTLHHVSRQEAALGELHRVLVPGGVLLLAESCSRFTNSWRVRALFRHPKQSQRKAADLVRLVRGAGFQVPDAAISTPRPFWARADFGLVERMTGRPPTPGGEPTQVNLVARRAKR